MRSHSSKSIDGARLSAFVLALVAALSFPVLAASLDVAGVNARTASSVANAPRLQPSPLLAIDQNRTTVVDRILREWGESLPWSNAGINNVQLREMLMGLRADHLLAATLAGNLDGLRNVLANALTSTAQVAPSLLQTKALGDIADDVVYTPVTPCRVVDSRYGGGGTLAAGATRNWLAANPGGNFTAQGGSSTNCGITIKPAAVLVNITVANTAVGPAFLTAWPYGQAQPNASTLNWTSGNTQIANAVIVPLCTGACADDFSFYVSSATDVIVDVAGYFARPKNYGGTHVITGQYATDSGGFSNTASGNDSTVGGGGANTASGFASTVAGGDGNTASGNYSTVGGGSNNTASGNDSTVAGGQSNTASGFASTVAGGADNLAGGSYSFAAGRRAKVYVDGSFVFSDSTDADFSSGTANEFIVGATGGIGMYTAKNYTTGCHIVPAGGTWSCSSSRDVKRDFARVNPREVLRKIVSLPMSSWRYLNEPAATRHMGPMAQDFWAAFGLGEDDKHISAVDAEGVALAAIQGLHHVLREKDREIVRLKARTDLMERKLQALEARLGLN